MNNSIVKKDEVKASKGESKLLVFSLLEFKKFKQAMVCN